MALGCWPGRCPQHPASLLPKRRHEGRVTTALTLWVSASCSIATAGAPLQQEATWAGGWPGATRVGGLSKPLNLLHTMRHAPVRPDDAVRRIRHAGMAEADDPAVCTVAGPCGNTTQHDLTDPIQAALDGCLRQNVGKSSAQVVLDNPNPEAGVCVLRITRSINLVNDTTLVIGRNVTLFSGRIGPAGFIPPNPRCTNSSSQGIICGTDLRNVGIIGQDRVTSVIDGGGHSWYYNETGGHGGMSGWVEPWWYNFRPRAILLDWSKNIYVADVTVQNSPSGTLIFYFCDRILAENIAALAPRWQGNTDGFDPRSCTDVVLRHSHIDVGDDGIAISAGHSTRAPSVPMPSRNIHIWNTTILARNFAIGSGTGGGIYDVTVEDCRIGSDLGSSPWAIKYKSHESVPGPMINHTYSRIKIGKIAPDSWRYTTGGTAFIIGPWRGQPGPDCPPMCPEFDGITFEDIEIAGAVTAGAIKGFPSNPLNGLSFRNVSFKIPPTHGWDCASVGSDFRAVNVHPPIDCKGAKMASGKSLAMELDAV